MSMIAVMRAGLLKWRVAALSGGTMPSKPRSRGNDGRRRRFRSAPFAVTIAPDAWSRAGNPPAKESLMADTTDNPGKRSGASKSSAAKPRKSAAAKPASTPRAAKAAKSSGAARTAPRAQARSRFTAAIEEARAGVEALKKDAIDRSSTYRAKAVDASADWVDEAKALSAEAKTRGAKLAKEGKSRASDGLAALGKTVSDNAKVIDEKLGPQYGDYARTAARSIQEAAAKLDSKEFGELGEDAKAFVRNSPGAAIGIAAVAGYFVARMFRGSND
jgi:hypothetical protein